MTIPSTAAMMMRWAQSDIRTRTLAISLGPALLLTLLLTGIASAVLLVLDVVLGRGPAVAVCAVLVVIGLVTWYGLPLRQRAGHPS